MLKGAFLTASDAAEHIENITKERRRFPDTLNKTADASSSRDGGTSREVKASARKRAQCKK